MQLGHHNLACSSASFISQSSRSGAAGFRGKECTLRDASSLCPCQNPYGASDAKWLLGNSSPRFLSPTEAHHRSQSKHREDQQIWLWGRTLAPGLNSPTLWRMRCYPSPRPGRKAGSRPTSFDANPMCLHEVADPMKYRLWARANASTYARARASMQHVHASKAGASCTCPP